MFEDAMYMSSHGPTPEFRSNVKRFVRDAMTTAIMHEMDFPQYSEIGPGFYKWPDALNHVQVGVPGLHLTEQPRFKIDASSADIKTELQLPGTEHIGPGKYVIQPESRIVGPNPMKRTAPRSYLDDPAAVGPHLTEGNKHAAVGPGSYFIPQQHLFCNEDGTAKASQQHPVEFKKDERFRIPPEDKERQGWVAQRPDLPGVEDHYFRETWDKHGIPLYEGHRIGSQTSGPGGYQIPFDDESTRQRHLSRRQSWLKRRSRTSLLPEGTSKAVMGTVDLSIKRKTPPPGPDELRHQAKEHGRNVHASVKNFKHRDPSASFSQARAEKLKKRVQEKASFASTAPLSTSTMTASTVSPTATPVVTTAGQTQTLSSASPTGLSPSAGPSPTLQGVRPTTSDLPRLLGSTTGSLVRGTPPRCASQIYRRRCDSPLLREPTNSGDSDAFVGNQTKFTIQFQTMAPPSDLNKKFNLYNSQVSREPESNLLHIHQPGIITNEPHGGKLGPGAYQGSAKFGVETPAVLKKKRALQKQAWEEFKGGCPAFKSAREREAQELFLRKGEKIIKNMNALFG